MLPEPLTYLLVLNCAFAFLIQAAYKQRALHLIGHDSKAGIGAFYPW